MRALTYIRSRRGSVITAEQYKRWMCSKQRATAEKFGIIRCLSSKCAAVTANCGVPVLLEIESPPAR